MIASGDNNKSIVVWDAKSKEIVTDAFIYHLGKIFDIAWSDSDKLLVSVGLDDAAIVWDIENKKKVRKFAVLDGEITSTCTFYGNENEFVVGGFNCTPRVVSIIN